MTGKGISRSLNRILAAALLVLLEEKVPVGFLSPSAEEAKLKRVFRPYLVKDRVAVKIYGLLSTTLIVPLAFLFVYMYTNYVERAPISPESTTALFWIGVGSSLLVLFPVLYAILSLERSKVILTAGGITVVNGYRKKTVGLAQIIGVSYVTSVRGMIVPTGSSIVMPYEAGAITYKENGKKKKLALPVGWYYLQDLVGELKTRLGGQLAIDEESFELWRKWYQTPLQKKARRVLLVVGILALWLIPPALAFVWFVGAFHLSLSDSAVWFFGGATMMVYTGLLLFLIRGIDALRRALRKSRLRTPSHSVASSSSFP